MTRRDPLPRILAAGLLALFAASLPARSARAGEEKKLSAPRAVANLEQAVREEMPQEEVYHRYQVAKTAIDDAGKQGKKDARKKAEAEEAQQAYDVIQADVAMALEMDHVPSGGWLMGIFSALLLWGGFFFCLRIAMKSTPQHELDEDETWPLRPDEP
jgi:hypothetical protein